MRLEVAASMFSDRIWMVENSFINIEALQTEKKKTQNNSRFQTTA
jgi:hypothetical protein